MPLLENALKRKAAALGADYFGVADLTLAADFVAAQGGEFLRRFPRAVSAGVRLPEGIVDELPRHREPMVAQTYDYTVYTVSSGVLDRVGQGITQALQAAGYSALHVPVTQTVDKAQLTGLFSQKLAAHLAGLGWIGKSCLLITPDHGPRVRWVSVLTDAPLEPGQPMAQRCGACKLCVEACPPRAFTGAPFVETEPRSTRFNAQACQDYRVEATRVSGARVCGMCVYVCPYGRKKQPKT
jgi:epoxyqueuosine reductase QueG